MTAASAPTHAHPLAQFALTGFLSSALSVVVVLVLWISLSPLATFLVAFVHPAFWGDLWALFLAAVVSVFLSIVLTAAASLLAAHRRRPALALGLLVGGLLGSCLAPIAAINSLVLFYYALHLFWD